MNKHNFLAAISASLLLCSASMPTWAADKTTDSVKKEQLPTESNHVTIVGKVLENGTNEPLTGASIEVNGKKCYSDINGAFSLQLPKGDKAMVTVSMISYESLSLEVDADNTNNMQVVLKH